MNPDEYFFMLLISNSSKTHFTKNNLFAFTSHVPAKKQPRGTLGNLLIEFVRNIKSCTKQCTIAAIWFNAGIHKHNHRYGNWRCHCFVTCGFTATCKTGTDKIYTGSTCVPPSKG